MCIVRGPSCALKKMDYTFYPVSQNYQLIGTSFFFFFVILSRISAFTCLTAFSYFQTIFLSFGLGLDLVFGYHFRYWFIPFFHDLFFMIFKPLLPGIRVRVGLGHFM